MLGQIRFPAVMRVSDTAFVAQLQDALRGDYPEFTREDEIGVALAPDGDFRTQATRRWRFSGRHGWSVVVAPEFVTLQAEAARYTDYFEFRDRFASVWEVTRDHIGVPYAVQQGLRYINHIERRLRPVEWTRYINEELLGPIASQALGGAIDEAICDIRLKQREGVLALKHGIVRAGPARKWGYLLDFDYFLQDRINEVDSASLLERFDSFHDVMYRLFRWSITSKAAAEFRGAPRKVRDA